MRRVRAIAWREFRHTVLTKGFIFGAIVLNYIDRQIVSILKPTLKAEFRLDDSGYALLVNIFTVCYACMYPVAGWLVDRWGARSMMLSGVLAWSSACLGAGLTKTFGQFAFCRGMLGLAEPIAFPSQLRVVTIWFPGTLRATANSLSVAGSSIGAIIAPPLVAPAPITVWISSMNRIEPGWSFNALSTPFRRCSKSPRYLVPASSAPMSSE
mgnify:CR=1 FL=1